MKLSLETTVDGPTHAKTLVFLHGWPDGPELWDAQVETLSKHYRCLRVTLPNFGLMRSSKGFDFPQIVEALNRALLERQIHQNDKRVVLIGHDWGAYLAYLYEKRFPDQVQSLITMDVGAQIQPRNLKESLIYFAYQGWLISAWQLGKIWPGLGNRMSRSLAQIGRAPHPQKTSFEMNYLYFYFWRDLLLKSRSSQLLRDYLPECPTLFLYGKKKPVQFHSERWIRTLKRRTDCKVVAFENAGHWLMTDQPKKTTRLIDDWVQSLEQEINSQHRTSGPLEFH